MSECWVIQLLDHKEGAIVSAEGEDARGLYVQHYDPDAYAEWGNGVTGRLAATDDLTKAMKFDTMAMAVACYRQVSTTVPLRPDGKPNRPMTAFTVQFLKVTPKVTP